MIFSKETHLAIDTFVQDVGSLPPAAALIAAVIALDALCLGLIVVTVNTALVHTGEVQYPFLAAAGNIFLWALIVLAGIGGFVVFTCYAIVESHVPDVPYTPEKV